ncbi:SOS response-associated peptidase [Leptolyngbya sp. AN02str]|uniref:SOS response-associated peptidase n=1 Tax=Leptolyngbya sp. AN02str TaxID=3423363 RepID=UPI003D31F5E5
MCGRYTQTASGQRLAETFRLADEPDMPARYNIAPTQTIAVVRMLAEEPAPQLAFMHWGLIPSWSKDPKMGARLFNARSETVEEKPSFRTAFKRRRCLIPADGFYEWQKMEDGKQPYFFYLPGKEGDRQPFGFAGLWEHWEAGDGSVMESCTILTTEANADMEDIHDRMPVIVKPEDYDRWLNPLQEGRSLHDILQPFGEGAIARYPVGKVVNNARNDSPECMEPAA